MYFSPNRDLPIEDSVGWSASHRPKGWVELVVLDVFDPVAQSVALALRVRWLQMLELRVAASREALRPATLLRLHAAHSDRRLVCNQPAAGKSAQDHSSRLEQPNHGKIGLLPRLIDAIPGLPTVGRNQMFDKQISYREPE